jgi:signal transduction histidine kinase
MPGSTACPLPLSSPCPVLEAEHRYKDGRLVPVELSKRAFNSFEARCLEAVVRDLSGRECVKQERRCQAASFAALSHRLIALQERERRLLSAELHDLTSPNLAALEINLRSLAKSLPPGTDGETVMLLDDATALLTDTANSLRKVCADLRPPVLDYAGLSPALQSYAHQFSIRTGIAVAVDCPLVSDLDPEVESTLFRIVQEALSNCSKHADADQVRIVLTTENRRIHLEVTDDGNGFSSATGPENATAGLGLLSMSERAQFVGGSLRVDSCLGQGTRLFVTIPAAAATRQANAAKPPDTSSSWPHLLRIDTGVRG